VQPIAANVALASPFIGKGPTDLLKGLVQYPIEGYRTQYGKLAVKPEEMGFFTEQLKRAGGFQSAKIARKMQARQAAKLVTQSTQNAERNNTIRLGKMLADAIKAENAGQTAKAEAIRAEFEKQLILIADEYRKQIESGNLEDAVKPPTEQTLRSALMSELYPGMQLDKVGKLKRQAVEDIYETIMVEDEEGESEDDEEEESEFDPALLE
jgi:hypothetical protein